MIVSNTQKLVKPNLFIIGAPKCGTTALSEYLREHPSVFMSRPKEPHYFASDMKKYRRFHTLDEYKGLFADCGSEKTVIGEASVWYLYSTEAVKNIARYNQGAKIIVMLRRPAEMVYSMHSQHLVNLAEDVPDFEKAWFLESRRARGECVPSGIRHLPNLFYSKIAAYGTQLQRVYQHFPRNQVHVILYDDFAGDTSTVFENVEQFLSIPPSGKSEFKRINSNTELRVPVIKKFIQLEHKYTRLHRKKYFKWSGDFGKKVMERILNIVEPEVERPILGEAIEAKIVENYLAEVELLSRLIKRNLDHWNAR